MRSQTRTASTKVSLLSQSFPNRSHGSISLGYDLMACHNMPSASSQSQHEAALSESESSLSRVTCSTGLVVAQLSMTRQRPNPVTHGCKLALGVRSEITSRFDITFSSYLFVLPRSRNPRAMPSPHFSPIPCRTWDSFSLNAGEESGLTQYIPLTMFHNGHLRNAAAQKMLSQGSLCFRLAVNEKNLLEIGEIHPPEIV